MLPTPGFHHLHLNSVDPQAAIGFYTRQFPSTHGGSWGGHPALFSPKLEPRQLGGLYEIRIYTMRPGAIPEQIERWAGHIGERVKLSPLAFAGYSELGDLNLWMHIWAYKDAAERFAV